MLFRWLIFFVTFFCLISHSKAQFGIDWFVADSLTENYFTNSFGRLTNTYNFTNNARYNLNSGNHTMFIAQSYRGSAIQTANTTFRDDQKFAFRYNYKYNEQLSLSAKQNWINSSDSPILGFNELSRINLMGGAIYSYDQDINAQIFAGTERNVTVGFLSYGTILQAKAQANNIKLEDFRLSIDGFSELLNLNLDRRNLDNSLRLNLAGGISDDALLFVDVAYKGIKRDLLIPQSGDEINYLIKIRPEDRITTNILLQTAISDNLMLDASLFYDFSRIDNYFNRSVSGFNLSSIKQSFDIDEANVNLNLKYSVKKIDANISYQSYNRTELNRVNNNHNVADNELDRIRQTESQRDNNTGMNTLVGRMEWRFSNTDTVYFQQSLALLRYDTPSEQNNDDRDEFSSYSLLGYGKKIDNRLSANIRLDLRNVHLVYLKSSRSSLNNWNRVIRLMPGFHFQSDDLMYSTAFEVVANYTVYDFESDGVSARSFSYRHIAYKDSLDIKLSKSISIQTKSFLRYFENGLLFWDSFSESPRESKWESFYKFLIFAELRSNIFAGIGARVYILNQSRLASGRVQSTDYRQVSFGPECYFAVSDEKYGEVRLTGWLESQRIGNNEARILPNLFINAYVNL